MFLGNLELGIKVTTEFLGGPEGYRPGDVYMVNDPYLVGSHTYDVNIFSPVFLEDRLIGFGATKAHWLDIGAKEAGRPVDTTEIYQEGYRFGPTAVYRAGEPVREVIDYITRNSRLPRSVWATSTPRSPPAAPASSSWWPYTSASGPIPWSGPPTRSSPSASTWTARRCKPSPTASTAPPPTWTRAVPVCRRSTCAWPCG